MFKLQIFDLRRYVDRGRRSVHFKRRCDTLSTSGFVGNVMFGDNRPGKGDPNMA